MKTWTDADYVKQAQELIKAAAPLTEINQPLILNLKKELAEGWKPQLLDDELSKLGYELQFYQITALDTLSGRSKELMDNFGENFEIWKKGQKPTDDEGIYFRGMEGFGALKDIDKRKK